jgi:cysteine-rich repeat protein
MRGAAFASGRERGSCFVAWGILSLGCLFLSSCSLLLGALTPPRCEGSGFLRCTGASEIRCEGGFEVERPLDDGDACTTDACDSQEGASHSPPAGLDDGDGCTTDACDPGTGAISHAPVEIDDQNPCTEDSCDPQTGDLSHAALEQGSLCDADDEPATRDICLGQGCAPSICSDGFRDPGAGEACDDGNQSANDGCSPGCALEADVFVLCDGSTGGDGSLEDPFRALQDAVQSPSTPPGATVLILPSSPQPCGGSGVISKGLILSGLADPSDPAAPARPVIDGGSAAAISFDAASGIQLIVRDLSLRANRAGGTVVMIGAGQLALIRIEASNASTASTGGTSAILCDALSSAGNDGLLLIDQSFIHDSRGDSGGLFLTSFLGGVCRAVVANSLFQDNGTNGTSFGGARVDASGPRLAVVYSTFDGNLNSSGDGAMACPGGAFFGSIDSSIVNNNNGAPGLDPDCAASFTDLFGGGLTGAGSLDADPLFVASGASPVDAFHLAPGSPCRGAANPSPLALPFDPEPIFGIDVFDHDFLGRPRPGGAGNHMGMFQDP